MLHGLKYNVLAYTSDLHVSHELLVQCSFVVLCDVKHKRFKFLFVVRRTEPRT
jgi:hypothetical protein